MQRHPGYPSILSHSDQQILEIPNELEHSQEQTSPGGGTCQIPHSSWNNDRSATFSVCGMWLSVENYPNTETEKKGAWNFHAKEQKEKQHRRPVEEARSRFNTRCFSLPISLGFVLHSDGAQIRQNPTVECGFMFLFFFLLFFFLSIFFLGHPWSRVHGIWRAVALPEGQCLAYNNIDNINNSFRCGQNTQKWIYLSLRQAIDMVLSLWHSPILYIVFGANRPLFRSA